MSHLYPVGATVTCSVLDGQVMNKASTFIVEAQMPPLGTALQYRIKNEAESFRRVVSEHQLSEGASSTAVSPVAAPPHPGEQD